MSQEVMADALGDEFKGYVLRITGGNDVRLVLYTSFWEEFAEMMGY